MYHSGVKDQHGHFLMIFPSFASYLQFSASKFLKDEYFLFLHMLVSERKWSGDFQPL